MDNMVSVLEVSVSVVAKEMEKEMTTRQGQDLKDTETRFITTLEKVKEGILRRADKKRISR